MPQAERLAKSTGMSVLLTTERHCTVLLTTERHCTVLLTTERHNLSAKKLKLETASSRRSDDGDEVNLSANKLMAVCMG